MMAPPANTAPPVPGSPLKFGTFRPGPSLCLGPPASAGGKKVNTIRTISGLYDTHDEAILAVEALGDAGISSSDISLVAPEGTRAEVQDADDTVAGASVGAALGGVGGLLAGLGTFAIPGIGPVIGAGWLATTLIGAAAGGAVGGLLGSLTDAGIDAQDAHVYVIGKIDA